MKKLIALFVCISVAFTFASGVAIEAAEEKESDKKYIKWVEFSPSEKSLKASAEYDISTYGKSEHLSWIDILARLAVMYGGDFGKYSSADMKKAVAELLSGSKGPDEKLFDYYREAYGAVLDGIIGEYYTESEINGETVFGEKSYGVRAFFPLAANYSYSHYDDFGASRSYGYKRRHLGHDIMGSVGTPVVAVEGGIAEAVGWNQYGGWRVGIRSFDGKRYYYYAHLRRGHPYNDMYEGKIVSAGEVIGYLGMTGYSAKEDTNNIKVPHLHIGMELIFDISQKDGVNQIWIDMYPLMNFLSGYRSKAIKAGDEYISQTHLVYPDMPR